MQLAVGKKQLAINIVAGWKLKNKMAKRITGIIITGVQLFIMGMILGAGFLGLWKTILSVYLNY